MQRRKFVQYSAMLAAGVSLEFTAIAAWFNEDKNRQVLSGTVSTKLQEDVDDLFRWLKSNGWTNYLEQALRIDLGLKGKALVKQLTAELDPEKLSALQSAATGFDDFTGNSLITPGFPAYSLLFHALASPRVRPLRVRKYPSLQQIDLLENYIYALSDWEQLKSIYKIQPAEELVVSVFAYEYRPAFKTPHHSYADMVYSRTGIGRIGEMPASYDAMNRCYTNKPAGDDKDIKKKVAVIPARYGLFIARKVKHKDISLITSPRQKPKGADTKDDSKDSEKTFLQPIRKLFNDDVLTGEGKLQYIESHKSEKLEKLSHAKEITFLNGWKPTSRLSSDLLMQDSVLTNAGSSFLVISKPMPLIRTAMENGKALYFKVPAYKEQPYPNRYFTALCMQKVEDVELLDGNGKVNLTRFYNKYGAPRNRPLFVNITNITTDSGKTFGPIPQGKNMNFEHLVTKGLHWAPLFEDSICDGNVYVDLSILKPAMLKGVRWACLPAFSIVTAPDFFPQVDPLDLAGFDIQPGSKRQSSFYEGGVASLSTARIKPNPKAIDYKNDKTADTYLAVFSAGQSMQQPGNNEAAARKELYASPATERGYDISGFLPDVASSVFAPGWDVTYCRLPGSQEIYVGTEGLGSPFVEDMKFCSALNGMWPATSPDAARTYQGGNERDYRNPTAVPLLDHEIGICKEISGMTDTYGWDGEQGPYLEKINKQWKINFTDLGRADAIQNALKGNFDMSVLRDLRSNELIARMECLKHCIETLPVKNFRKTYTDNIVGYTYLWLVSAEKVNWGQSDAVARCIPANLVGNDKRWIQDKANAKISGEGYLYVFADSARDTAEGAPKEWADNVKRRRLDCMNLYVCQVTNDPKATHTIAWTKVNLQTGSVSWQVK